MKKSTEMITIDEILETFDYSPETGAITFKSFRPRRHFHTDRAFIKWNNEYAGKELTVLDQWGYIKVRTRIHRTMLNLAAHRLAFVCMLGRWPKQVVDHRNLIRSDNRWENLRECSMSENLMNIGISSNNKTGVKNVSMLKGGQYRACVAKDKKVYAKNFKSLEEAKFWADSKRTELHGEFARSS